MNNRVELSKRAQKDLRKLRTGRVRDRLLVAIRDNLEDDEVEVENTPGRSAGPGIPGNYEGFAFLTNRAFLFAAELSPLKTDRWRFDFDQVWDVQGNPDMPGAFSMAVHDGEPETLDDCTPWVFSLYPSEFSLQVFRGLVDGARASHR